MKQLLQDIRYKGDEKTFVWKSEIEDFSLGSSLTVNANQEALFISNGRALDLLPSGRHVLETHNIPLLRKLHEALYGGNTPFHCSIYFVNQTEQMALKWGTDSQIEYIDPTYNFPIKIGMNGDMALKVNDSRKLVLKLVLVGAESSLTREQFVSYFRGILMSRLKPYVATFMRQKQVNIFEIDENLSIFSDELKKIVAPEFDEYGVTLTQFSVSGVVKPDGDRNYNKFRELHYRNVTEIAEAKLEASKEALRMDIESEAMARKREREGYSYQQERGFDVAQDVARNEASGQFVNMGVGLGAMAGIGGAMGGVLGGAVSGAFTGIGVVQPQTATNSFCDQCGAELTPEAAFCDNCGAPQSSSASCTKCGFTFIKPGNFCPKCGTKKGGIS